MKLRNLKLRSIKISSKLFSGIKVSLHKIYFEKFIFRFSTTEQIMRKIYKGNYWGDSESVSGPGSNLAQTSELVLALPGLFKELKVESVFDAPCGDMNWMRKVLEEVDISYLGGDIVQELVDKNISKYSNITTDFKKIDITSEIFPASDLWLCRHIFFHLSFQDICRSLENFLMSGTTYILTTNSVVSDNHVNNDIKSGHWREINLFDEPFNFPKEVLWKINDSVSPAPPTNMILLKREQIIKPVAQLRDKI